MNDEVDGSCAFHAEKEYRAAGLEDPARTMLAIFSCPQRGPRMMGALTLYAEGVSARDAAAAVGFRDQREVERQASRCGLRRLHRARQLERKRVQLAVRDTSKLSVQVGKHVHPARLLGRPETGDLSSATAAG